MCRRIYDPRMGPHYPRLTLALFSSPRQSAIGRWGSGFHTVRGGVDPGDHRLRPRAVGVVDIRRDFFAEDGDLSSPGASGSWGSPEGQLPPRAPRPLSDQGRGGGGRLGQLDLGSENAGIKVICLLCYIRDDAAAMQNLLVVLGATSVMLLLLSMLRTLWVDYHSGMILYCSTANKFGI